MSELNKLLPPDLLAEIKRLQFQTRRFAEQGVSGQYRSAFRGHGLEFEEVREYNPGDEIRSIDWKVTARSGQPYVKSFREERELTVMILVDISQSTDTGTRTQLRSTLIAKIGALLTLIAMRNNDRVGLVTFSADIVNYFPPSKKRGSVWRLLHEVLAARDFSPAPSGRTDFAKVFAKLHSVLKRRSIIFVLSDFIGGDFSRELTILSKRHDVNAIVVGDPSEEELPAAGLFSCLDPETGERFLIDTSSAAFRALYMAELQRAREIRERSLRRSRARSVYVTTDKPFMPALRRLFDSRLAAK